MYIFTYYIYIYIHKHSWPTVLQFMPKQSLSHTYMFSFILCLDHWKSFSCRLNSKTDTQSIRTQKPWHYIEHEKDTCLHYESWNKGGGCQFLWSLLGTWALGDSHFPLLCASLWMTMNVPWVLILGLQIYFSMQQNSQMYSLRIMSTDCTQKRVCSSIS